MKQYGVPYKGSKNKLAEKILPLVPKTAHFYDLFAGGCAVTHAAILSGKFECVHANDIQGMGLRLFTDAVNGKYRNERRWISREEFERLKDSDPYVQLCWSFGNNQEYYLYSRELEPWKRALHYARVFKDFSMFREFGIETDGSSLDIKRHYKEYLQKYIAWLDAKVYTRLQNLQSLQSLQRLQRLQSLQSLQSLQRLQRLEATYNDYRDIRIKNDSVIYCDPPYQATTEYAGAGSGFNHEEFYEWCCKQTSLVLISEYNMPQEQFACVAAFSHVSSLNATINKRNIEKIFVPKNQLKEYLRRMSL